MKTNDKEFKEALKNLERRISEISSNDGLFTLKYTGMGEYISCKINGKIEEIDEETLEKSIIECLNNQKREVSNAVFNTLLDLTNESNKEENKDENLGVTIEDVS